MATKKEEIQIDITKHELVPKHTVLDEKEKLALFEKYGINEFNLPKILKGDVAIRDLDIKEGNIIKIERASPTAGKTVYYRLVI